MSSSALSDISQNDAKILKKQWQEIQQRHKEEQQFLVQLEEVAKLCQAECVAQKARREAEAKAKEETEKRRIAEEKKKLEYIQWLWNEVLEEEAALLEGAEGSQVAGSKCKEIAARDEEEQWPSKKAKENNRGSTVGVLTPVRGMWVLGRIVWCTPQGEWFIIILIIIIF